MDDESSKQKSQRKPNTQDHPQKSEEISRGKGKSWVSLGVLWWGLFAFCALWAGYFGSLGHDYLIYLVFAMLAASVFGALGLRLELRNHHWVKKHYDRVAYGIVIVALLLGIPVIIRDHSRAERAHFVLSLRASDKAGDFVPLTNDFLAVKKWEAGEEGLGWVIMPIQMNQTNYLLRLNVHSPVFADKAEILIAFPKQWGIAPDFGWEPVRQNLKWTFTSASGVTTNESQGWGLRLPVAFLPGDGFDLPDILITNIVPATAITAKPERMEIMVKSKDWPPEAVSFGTAFLPVSQEYSQRPIVTLARITNGKPQLSFSLVKTNNMK
jgi:hypothetical protein